MAGGHSIDSEEFFFGLAAASGCDSLRTLHLDVETPLQSNLGNIDHVCPGDTLVITPGKFDSYLWQDGSVPDHFDVSKTGLTQYWSLNTCGTNQSQINITQQCCIISFPNAFTPNGDGLNDQFHALNAPI